MSCPAGLNIENVNTQKWQSNEYCMITFNIAQIANVWRRQSTPSHMSYDSKRTNSFSDLIHQQTAKQLIAGPKAQLPVPSITSSRNWKFLRNTQEWWTSSGLLIRHNTQSNGPSVTQETQPGFASTKQSIPMSQLLKITCFWMTVPFMNLSLVLSDKYTARYLYCNIIYISVILQYFCSAYCILTKPKY